MSRLITHFPSYFTFSTTIPVRITDINYGGHAGNDAILSIIHEARMQYLRHLQLSELDFGGHGLIMKQVAIEFKKESFYGDTLQVFVTAGEFTAAAFTLFYKLERTGGAPATIAVALTGLVCFDYQKRKIAVLPDHIREKLI